MSSKGKTVQSGCCHRESSLQYETGSRRTRDIRPKSAPGSKGAQGSTSGTSKHAPAHRHRRLQTQTQNRPHLTTRECPVFQEGVGKTTVRRDSRCTECLRIAPGGASSRFTFLGPKPVSYTGGCGRRSPSWDCSSSPLRSVTVLHEESLSLGFPRYGTRAGG